MMDATLDRVRNYIREGLSSGYLAAGGKLPAERHLAERFGTSRAAVRHALTILEVEERISRHIGRGTFVAPSAAAEPREAGEAPRPGVVAETSPAKLMEVRALLEPPITELVVLTATEADLRSLRELVRAQRRDQRPERFEARDIAFHRTLARVSHNPLLVGLAETILAARDMPEWRKLKASVAKRHPRRRGEAIGEHGTIVRALEERNAAEAGAAMRRHLAQIRANLLPA